MGKQNGMKQTVTADRNQEVCKRKIKINEHAESDLVI